MSRRGPLADSYPGAVALVVFSLIPYLVLTAAIFPLATVISKSIGLTLHAFDVTVAVSTGAYAVGTVLAVQFAVHLAQRRLLLVYETVFVIASLLTAWAPSAGVFVGAFIVQGLCTSLLLIAAVPPLVTRWPAKRMPVTGMIMNLCIFGAVAVGPTIGAAQLLGHDWRPLFWGVAGLAGLALLFSVLTYVDDPAADTSAPWDLGAVALATIGCAAAFFGAGQLEATLTTGLDSLVPLVAGFALVLVLIVYQYVRRDPLMPVKATSTSIPVAGIFIALMASAAGFGIMELLLEALKSSSTPAHTALLFLPEFGGAILVAGLFGALFRTRFTPLLALSGLLAIAASAGLVIAELPSSGPEIAVATGLLGVGVAASVSPALFMAGFSLRSALLQRVFALIELMRGVTAFLVAPILIFLAGVISTSPLSAVKGALGICLALAFLGFFGGVAFYLSGGRRLEAPDLERWQGDGEPAWSSPPLFGRVGRLERRSQLDDRSGRHDGQPEERSERVA